MSKRRKVGDVVIKKAGAGFKAEELVVRLVHYDLEFPPTDYCILNCGDSGCQEWINSEVVNSNPIKYACHISECEMLDVENS